METIKPVTNWEKDMTYRVRGDRVLCVEAEELDLKEKQICLRRQNMKEEVSASGSKNLYEILGLNMKIIRSKTFEEQNEILKKAYRSQLLHWHPDKNHKNGDNAICQEILKAYKNLKDPEARAAYNNVADYDKGWLSKARWIAIFNPECYSKEQRKQYLKRIWLLLLSAVIIAGGISITCVTAGISLPIVIATSGALIGGWLSSGLRTVNRESVRIGCFCRKYFTRLVVGGVG